VAVAFALAGGLRLAPVEGGDFTALIVSAGAGLAGSAAGTGVLAFAAAEVRLALEGVTMGSAARLAPVVAAGAAVAVEDAGPPKNSDAPPFTCPCITFVTSNVKSNSKKPYLA
jgi:hypothetical protein